MITQSIENIRRIELTEIIYNKDTGESSRFLNIDSGDGRISLLLSTKNFRGADLKVLDYELKKVLQQ